LNFSHGTHDEHRDRIQRLRSVAAALGRPICLLQDLQGPKIRTGKLKDHLPVTLATGQSLTITANNIAGSSGIIATTYQGLANDVKRGERILLSDGKIELEVRDVQNGDVVCEVVNGGTLAENQGINLPGTNISIPSLTPKDLADLEFGMKNGIDVVAVSFVR